MNVKNRKCILKAQLKSLMQTSPQSDCNFCHCADHAVIYFYVHHCLSLNASYETYQFRQVGGCVHGTFKDVSSAGVNVSLPHPKGEGARKAIGNTAWKESFQNACRDQLHGCQLHQMGAMPPPLPDADARKRQRGGRRPRQQREALGVTPERGAEVTVSYSITDKDQTTFIVTDTFTLVGYWDYDELMPVHYINISRLRR